MHGETVKFISAQQANPFVYIYFDSLHVSRNHVLIIRRVNCINKTSGICHSVKVAVRYARREGTSRPAYRTVRVTYTRCCIDTIDSPDDEHKVGRKM